MIRAWLDRLAPRERRLLGVAALLTLAVGAGGIGLEVLDDMTRLRARVAAHERELAQVRRLAATVRQAPSPAAGTSASLASRIEGIVGKERLTSMAPASTPTDDGLSEEHLTIRIADTSLAETVRLLHTLESDAEPVGVVRLELHRQPGDGRRLDVVMEVARVVNPS